MAESQYPDDLHFAGLVQAATAAADEHDRHVATQNNKRKYSESFTEDNFEDSELQINPELEIIEEDGMLQNSASVLFREPSAKSRKYSRPPLGKVYASLELAPENFLRLQTAAKDFMLDPQHPERKNVVGNRAAGGNSDVAKLKLWNCVEEFLSNYGYGVQYFGRNAGEGIPGAPVRTLFWPEHEQKIVKLMMPLMRKMVTNERQRLYAAETRGKVPQKDTDTVGDEGKSSQNDSTALPPNSTPSTNNSQEGSKRVDKTQMGAADESLARHQADTAALPANDATALYVNLLSHNADRKSRLVPKFKIGSDIVRSLTSLRKEAWQRLSATTKDGNRDKSKIEHAVVKVWLPDGLVPVNTDGEWMVALLTAARVEWMDGELTVLIEV